MATQPVIPKPATTGTTPPQPTPTPPKANPLPSIRTFREVEQNLVDLLEIAAATCDELSQLPNDAKLIRDRSRQYYTLINNVQSKLTTQIERIPDQPRFQHSVYLSRKQAEISYMKTQVVASELSKLVQFFDEKVPSPSTNPLLTNIISTPNSSNLNLNSANNTNVNSVNANNNNNNNSTVTTPQQIQRPSTPNSLNNNNSNSNNNNQKRT